MTKVGILLLLPTRLKNDKIATKKLSLEGVVVRAEEAEAFPGKFNIAVFFNNIREPDRINLNRFLVALAI